MKKLVSLLLLTLCGITVALAKDKDHSQVEKRMREVQEYKMKFLAQEMELSEQQKKQFFELYEEMSEAKMNCYKEAVQLDRKVKHNANATESDYEEATKAFNTANEAWAEKEKYYNEKFSEFLSPKQIYKMKEAENTFRSRFEEMKQKRKKEHRR